MSWPAQMKSSVSSCWQISHHYQPEVASGFIWPPSGFSVVDMSRRKWFLLGWGRQSGGLRWGACSGETYTRQIVFMTDGQIHWFSIAIPGHSPLSSCMTALATFSFFKNDKDVTVIQFIRWRGRPLMRMQFMAFIFSSYSNGTPLHGFFIITWRSFCLFHNPNFVELVRWVKDWPNNVP